MLTVARPAKRVAAQLVRSAPGGLLAIKEWERDGSLAFRSGWFSDRVVSGQEVRFFDGAELRRLVGGHATDFVSLDFWTEAALFSESGATALVYGPGDIAQAHTAGEWVALADLVQATADYTRILT